MNASQLTTSLREHQYDTHAQKNSVIMGEWEIQVKKKNILAYKNGKYKFRCDNQDDITDEILKRIEKFTSDEEELTAEIETREKIYEYLSSRLGNEFEKIKGNLISKKTYIPYQIKFDQDSMEVTVSTPVYSEKISLNDPNADQTIADFIIKYDDNESIDNLTNKISQYLREHQNNEFIIGMWKVYIEKEVAKAYMLGTDISKEIMINIEARVKDEK